MCINYTYRLYLAVILFKHRIDRRHISFHQVNRVIEIDGRCPIRVPRVSSAENGAEDFIEVRNVRFVLPIAFRHYNL